MTPARFTDRQRLTAAAAGLLEGMDYLGVDPEYEGVQDTPLRVAKAWEEMLSGYAQDPGEVLSRSFPGEGYSQLIMLHPIPFWSTCEHHLLPFFGTAAVAYIPGDGRIVGLSKLARLVDCYARRLQVQERMTEQIAAALVEHLSPIGYAVVVRAQHACMLARGVQKHSGFMSTSAIGGVLQESGPARQEFFSLLEGQVRG